MRIFLVFALILCLNITYAAAGDSLSSWSGHIKAGGFFLKGNTDKFSTSGEFQLMFRKGIIESILSATASYGESDGVKDENDRSATYTLDFYYDNIWSPFILQFAEYSFARNIDLRSQSGAGIKYTFVPFPKYKSSLSAAGIFDYTNYKNVPGYDDSKTFRLSIRLKSKILLLNGMMVLSHVTFYQPSVKEIRDRIWRSETSVGINITSMITFSTTYKYQYEYYTVEDRKNTTMKWISG